MKQSSSLKVHLSLMMLFLGSTPSFLQKGIEKAHLNLMKKTLGLTPSLGQRGVEISSANEFSQRDEAFFCRNIICNIHKHIYNVFVFVCVRHLSSPFLPLSPSLACSRALSLSLPLSLSLSLSLSIYIYIYIYYQIMNIARAKPCVAECRKWNVLNFRLSHFVNFLY